MKTNTVTLAALTSFVSLAACATERMATSPAFARSAEEMPIEGTAAQGMEALWFGDFTVISMEDQPMVSTRRADLVTEERKYSFTLLDRGGTNWSTDCNAIRRFRDQQRTADSKEAAAVRGPVSLRCQIASDDADRRAVPVELRLEGIASGPHTVLGEVRLAGGTLEIVSTHRAKDGDKVKEVEVPLGFEILSENNVVAAVQTKGSQVVWIAPKISGETVRSVAGVSAAALVLFDNNSN